VKKLYCRLRVLVVGFNEGHDWEKVGATTMRECRRCGEHGWEI
jgi:hypothetical protein